MGHFWNYNKKVYDFPKNEAHPSSHSYGREKLNIVGNIWFLCSLKINKKNYMKKTPYEKWYFVRHIHMMLVKLIGVDVMNDNYEVNIKTLIPILVEVNFLCLLTYTLIHYRNEPFKALIATPPIGILIPVSLFEFRIEMSLIFQSINWLSVK